MARHRRPASVREAELGATTERRGVELAARRPEAHRSQPESVERAHPALEQLRLVAGVEPAPRLVAPAVVGHLVARGGDRRERVRIELRVEALDEERRAQTGLLERREDPRQRPGHGEVPAERLALGNSPRCELGDLAEVVERERVDGDQVRSAATGFSSRPTRSISTTTRSPSRSSTFGSRR